MELLKRAFTLVVLAPLVYFYAAFIRMSLREHKRLSAWKRALRKVR